MSMTADCRLRGRISEWSQKMNRHVHRKKYGAAVVAAAIFDDCSAIAKHCAEFLSVAGSVTIQLNCRVAAMVQ